MVRCCIRVCPAAASVWKTQSLIRAACCTDYLTVCDSFPAVFISDVQLPERLAGHLFFVSCCPSQTEMADI